MGSSLEERIQSVIEDLIFDAQTADLLAQAQLALHDACSVNTTSQQQDRASLEMSYNTLEGAKILTAIDAKIHSIERLESLANGRMSGSRAPVELRLRAEFIPHEMAKLEAKQGANASQSMAMNDTAAARAAIKLGQSLEDKDKQSGASTGSTKSSTDSDAQAIKADYKLFLVLHRALFSGTDREALACQLRSSNDQLGGDRFHKTGTPYHTPPADMIISLLDNLADFCAADDLPALVQAALAHTQIMLINPFERGNGKIANATIQLVLSRRNVITDVQAPLSLGFMLHPHDYEDSIASAVDGIAKGNSEQLLAWIGLFSESCLKAASTVAEFDRQVNEIEQRWFKELSPRSNSVASLLLPALRGMPVFDVTTASDCTHRSAQRTSAAVDELAQAGIITQVTQGKRNRVFEAPEIISAYSSIKGLE